MIYDDLNNIKYYDRHINTFHKFDENKIGVNKIIKTIKDNYL